MSLAYIREEIEKLENEILAIQLYEEKLPNYAVETLEEYIHHFSSFNFEHKKSSSIIVDASSIYKFILVLPFKCIISGSS